MGSQTAGRLGRVSVRQHGDAPHEVGGRYDPREIENPVPDHALEGLLRLAEFPAFIVFRADRIPEAGQCFADCWFVHAEPVRDALGEKRLGCFGGGDRPVGRQQHARLQVEDASSRAQARGFQAHLRYAQLACRKEHHERLPARGADLGEPAADRAREPVATGRHEHGVCFLADNADLREAGGSGAYRLGHEAEGVAQVSGQPLPAQPQHPLLETFEDEPVDTFSEFKDLAGPMRFDGCLQECQAHARELIADPLLPDLSRQAQVPPVHEPPEL